MAIDTSLLMFSKEKQAHRKIRKKSKYIKPGEKARKWSVARAKAKLFWSGMGVTKCLLKIDGCWGSVHGFAHLDKRRYLSEDELYRPDKLVPACNHCHQIVEKYPREKMRQVLEAILFKHLKYQRK